MKAKKIKEYRVSHISCEGDPRCSSPANQTIRLWPDASAGPFCYFHARAYVAELEEQGYKRRTY